MDYKEGASLCDINAQRLRTSAKILIEERDGTNAFALYLYGVANEELAKSIWCLFVHRGWINESFIEKVFRWHHTKLFLLEEMLESFSVKEGKGLLGGQELGNISLQEFVDKHENLIEEHRKQAKDFLYVDRKDVWNAPEFYLDNFDELCEKFEDKYRKLDLFRQFVLVEYDKQASLTDNFHISKNEDGSYSIRFDQV